MDKENIVYKYDEISFKLKRKEILSHIRDEQQEHYVK